MMPLIFAGHGNPMYAIEENEYTEAWHEIGQSLPKPKAVVVISAHWETAGTFVTAMERPRTIHDFYGFPQPLFDVHYDACGSPELARQIVENLDDFNVQPDHSWGLDHGSWAVLRHIYPEAKLPVLQISLDRTKSPGEHFELAEKLDFLRDENILVIGSGNIVHNLRLINFRQKSGDLWANTANETLKELIASNDFESLIDYQNLSNEVQLGIPTPEHFLPLLYVLALKKDHEKIKIFNDQVELGSLSMTSFIID